jgi:phage shock protein PspC (stress-responsive transcriptional regulator)
MNKIININLGGSPIVIDENAYVLLSKYLDALQKHFSNAEGADEIIHDIEVRMTELFFEKLKGRQIVTLKDLNEVMDIMGRPEQMQEDSQDSRKSYAYEHKDRAREKADYSIRTGKKLFRDEEHKILAGVCSGLAKYFGVHDPVWIRLFFVLFSFSGGGVLAYIVFWAIVPAAKSSTDKLAMQGEPINVDSIAKKVQEELTEFSKTISDFGKEMSKKA